MNLAWVLRRALIDCNVVKQNNTTPAIITQADLVSWAQDAVRELEALWRKSDGDFNTRVMNSADSTAIILGENYDPTDFAIVTTTLDYTLPPDLVTIKRIRVTDTAYKHYIFTPMDLNNSVFRNLNQQWTSTTNPTGSEIYYDIIDRRTLHLSHTLPATAQIEIVYNARLPLLYVYDTPTTANMTNASTAVVIASGELVNERISLPASLLLASDGGTVEPVIVTQTASAVVVLPGGELEYPIESITDDTNLVLEAVYPGVTDTAIAGLISNSGDFWDDHYALVIRYVRHMVYGRLGNAKASLEQLGHWQMGKRTFEYDIAKRVTGIEFVEDWEG